MSARREARSRAPVGLRANGQVPAALMVGRCIEVWADPAVEFGHFSAMRRHDLARGHWGAMAGLDRLELQEVLETSGPWSADYMIEAGHGEYVLERFARAGCTPNDIPALHDEAAQLIKHATKKARTP